MKRVLFLLVAMIFFLPTMSWAGSIKCSRYQIHLEGSSNKIPGYDYKEVVDMHKVDSSSGYDGRWKIDRIIQITKYPSGGFPTMDIPTRVDFPNGSWMMCNAIFVNNITVMDCSGGEMYLDVSNNRIGSKQTNIWQGKIQGRKVTYRFDPNNTLEPVLTGEVKEPVGSHMNFSISASAGNKYAFDDSTIGVLEMEFNAQVTPSQYEQDVEWEVPEIEGSTLTLDPLSGKGPHLIVRYEGLPKSNSQFGPKTIKALVDVGGCQADDSKEVKVFFDRDAKNNPGGEYPNWFYYWKQTPAGRPRNQHIVLEYGGTSFDLCSQKNVPALYKPGAGHATIHVCNLGKLGPQFPITYPILTLQPPYFKGFVTSTHIDSFAVAVRHEFEHWQIDHNYRFGKSDAEIEAADTDQDGLPDSVEPQYGFDPTKKQTFLSTHSSIKNIGEDEEWLAYMSMSEIEPGSLDQHDWARPGKQW